MHMWFTEFNKEMLECMLMCVYMRMMLTYWYFSKILTHGLYLVKQL